MKAEEAFKVKAGRGGGGKPTVKNLMRKSRHEMNVAMCVMNVVRLMRRGDTLEEACQKMAEKMGEPDKENTVRDWYRKHHKGFPESFIERMEREDPDFDDFNRFSLVSLDV